MFPLLPLGRGNACAERAYRGGMPPRSIVRTVVLARTLRDFHAWCTATGTSPRDRSVLYASGPHALRGITGVRIVHHGDWWNRPDGRALEDAVDQLERRSDRVLESASV